MMISLSQRNKLKPLALSLLLLVGVTSIFLPHGLASYRSERTYYDLADQFKDGGGIGASERRAKAFTNGTMWLEVCSGMWAWADAKGWVIWSFQPPYTLSNAKVSANFITSGLMGTWFSSAHLWFTLDVNGVSTEYYEFFGNYKAGEIPRDKTLTINFATMNQGTTYTIKATIRIHTENTAFIDLESWGTKPLMAPKDYQGYGRVTRMVVEAP